MSSVMAVTWRGIVPGLSRRIPEVPAPRPDRLPETGGTSVGGGGGPAPRWREASEREPLTLLLDDLHWTDKPTLHLLKHLLTHGSGLRALIIGTYRESDIGRGHPLFELLADLNKVEGVERISLAGLDEGQTREMMEHAAGHELDETGSGWRAICSARPTATPSTPARCFAT